MICYNVCVIGVIHIKNKLNMKLYKNNNLIIDKNNIAYSNNFDKILFEIDEDSYYITNNDNLFILNKETNDYVFNLEISNDNKCDITLKKENAIFPIMVEEAMINKEDNKITIYYQLETDDESTTIEIFM